MRLMLTIPYPKRSRTGLEKADQEPSESAARSLSLLCGVPSTRGRGRHAGRCAKTGVCSTVTPTRSYRLVAVLLVYVYGTQNRLTREQDIEVCLVNWV